MSVDGALLAMGSFLACAVLYGAQNAQQENQPQHSLPYQQEEVTYTNPAALGVTLAGTFTKPVSGGPFPAVLLITGPGPQDRDETIAGHKPFLVLADYLSHRSLAVLRVDDRGTAKSRGDFQTATTQDFASDAEAGVQYLMKRSDVDGKHIGLIGHGEGAIVAAMVASQNPDVSFIVLLAGTALPGEQVLIDQTEHAERAAHVPEEQINADKRIGTMLYDLVREGKSQADLREALYKMPAKYRPFFTPWQQQLPRFEAPWLRFFLSYNPAVALEKVKCPVLALDGEKNTQSVPEKNIAALKAAFARSGNPDVTIQLLPKLNYMFQTANTGLGWEYATIRETISPSVLNIIDTWISKHVPATASSLSP